MLARRLASTLRVNSFVAAPVYTRFFSSENLSEAELFKMRKRLLYRSQQRGFLELDVLVGGFAKDYVPTMTVEELREWEEILKEENPEMTKWLIGMLPIPAEYENNKLFMRLVEYSQKPNPRRTIFDEE